MDTSRIFKKLEATGKLPTPSGVVFRLLEITRQPDASVKDIVEVVGADPALAGKILRFVNSPMAGVGREVTSLHNAVALLGTRTVKMMALSFSVLSSRSKDACRGFDSQRFNVESLACAICAKHLAAVTRIGEPQDSYVAGLLCQIGRSALACTLPDEYAVVLREAKADIETLPGRELAALGTTYAAVGGHLLRTWGVPESLCGAIETFRSLDEHPEAPAFAQLLFVAEAGASVLVGESNAPRNADRFVTAGRKYFALSDAQIEAILRAASQELTETSGVLELPAGEQREVEEVAAEVRDRITELGLAMHLENQSLVQRQEDLLRRATTDPLTGVGNRAAFDARLKLELERAARDGSSPGLLMIDIDYFKKINDQFGHQAGDWILQAVARIFDENVRKVDYVARYGGEEFAIIAPNMAIEGLVQFAERLRLAVEANTLRWEGRPLRVTVSIGAACALEIQNTQSSAVSLIRAADENLYAAKSAGRNRVASTRSKQPMAESVSK